MENIVVKYPIPNRFYYHYKGGIYKFLFMAKHSETDEPFVIYKSILYGSYHARPLRMWFEEVPNFGSRFKLIEKKNYFEMFKQWLKSLIK